jgi:hypothetical protein
VQIVEKTGEREKDWTLLLIDYRSLFI